MMRLRRLFRWLKEAPRNKGREELCAALCAIGVDARIAERGRPEEQTRSHGDSLGVIDVGQGPIGWINLSGDYSPEGGSCYTTDYGVPDPRHLPKLEIRSIRMRRFPIFGRVLNVRWKGGDHGFGLGHCLSSDETIRSAIMSAGDEVRVVARRDHGCWLIRHETFFSSHIPSAEQWSCYQAIAEHLLEVRVPGHHTPS